MDDEFELEYQDPIGEQPAAAEETPKDTDEDEGYRFTDWALI